MTNDQFNIILESRIAKTRDVLESKNKEYASNDNKLHNFDRAARVSGKPREVALWGMAMKHLVSFMDIIDKIESGTYPDEALLDEKVGDLINYLILAEASIKDNIRKL